MSVSQNVCNGLGNTSSEALCMCCAESDLSIALLQYSLYIMPDTFLCTIHYYSECLFKKKTVNL